MIKQNFKLISKTIYFPKQKILAIGDLHIGYEEMLKKQGMIFPFNQLEDTKKQIENIIKKLKKQGDAIKKIILLGDIKHHFNFEKSEIFDLRDFLKFIEKFISKNNLILIKGNHDTFSLKDYELRKFYIKEDLAFIHGDEWFKKLEDKKIKTIIMSHIHPAVLIKDKRGIKREKYKCFLIGNCRKKQIIIVPSFFSFSEGTGIEEYEKKEGKEFSIIPKNKLSDFNIYAVGEDKIYEFGKHKNLEII